MAEKAGGTAGEPGRGGNDDPDGPIVPRAPSPTPAARGKACRTFHALHVLSLFQSTDSASRELVELYKEPKLYTSRVKKA